MHLLILIIDALSNIMKNIITTIALAATTVTASAATVITVFDYTYKPVATVIVPDKPAPAPRSVKPETKPSKDITAQEAALYMQNVFKAISVRYSYQECLEGYYEYKSSKDPGAWRKYIAIQYTKSSGYSWDTCKNTRNSLLITDEDIARVVSRRVSSEDMQEIAKRF